MTDYRIWPATNGPSSDAGDHAAYSMGVEVYATQDVWVKAIHYWRGTTGITAVVDAAIYKVSDQSIVTGTQVTFTAPGSTTGWLTATIATPIKLDANVHYKAVVLHPDNYSATGGYFATGPGVGGITNGPLVAPDASLIAQGTDHAGSSLAFPLDQFNGGNYWTDLTVTDVDPASSTRAVTAVASLAATSVAGSAKTARGSAAGALAAIGQVTARKAAPITTAGLVAATSIAAGRKVSVAVTASPVCLTGAGAPAKKAAVAAPAVLGLAGRGSGARIAPVTAGTGLAVTATSSARKTTAVAALSGLWVWSYGQSFTAVTAGRGHVTVRPATGSKVRIR